MPVRSHLSLVIKGDFNDALDATLLHGIQDVSIDTFKDVNNSTVVKASTLFVDQARDWFFEVNTMPEGGYPKGTLLFWSIKEE